MSEIQSKILGALTVMPEHCQQQVCDFINREFGTYDDEPLTENEIKAIEGYMNGDPEYQPDISLEDFKKELGIV